MTELNVYPPFFAGQPNSTGKLLTKNMSRSAAALNLDDIFGDVMFTPVSYLLCEVFLHGEYLLYLQHLGF